MPCLVFFSHMGLKSASSQIHIDSFVLFCKLKNSHSFDADRNRCPLQSVELLEAEPEQASFLLSASSSSFFHLPDPEEKGQRNPLNP